MSVLDDILLNERYVLTRPITVGGEEVAILELPFKSLRGRDLVAAQSEYEVMTGDAVALNISDTGFHAYLIAKLAKIPFDVMMDDVHIVDFNTLTLAARSFLIRGA